MNVHLLQTHLVMEAAAVATARTLASNHPVRALLRPHQRFVIARGEEARNRLINPTGFVDQILGGTLAGSLTITKDAWAAYHFMQHALPEELIRRGVADEAALPHYPYRDDARLLWKAIAAYVGEYLALWYRGSADVAADREVQAWAAELTSPTGAAIKGLTPSGGITTLDELHDVLTQLIFTLGPQHSAVNYPQWDDLAYVANGPFALYGAPFEATSSPVSFLPPRKQTIRQIEIMWALASYRFDRLGDEAVDADPRVAAVVAGFRAALRAAEAEIQRRNRKAGCRTSFSCRRG
jgi:arachidonate 15-lipoxygenase